MKEGHGGFGAAAPLGALALIGVLAYGATLTIPAWETDTWVLHLASQRASQAPSLSEALAAFRFILSNPKGWSDFFILASWWGLYRLWGASTLAFHAFGVGSHVVAAALLHAYARRRGASPRASAWASLLFLVLPLNHDVVAVEAQSQYPLFAMLGLGSVLLLEGWQRGASAKSLVAGLVLYLAALGTKELAFAIPPLLALDALEERLHDSGQRNHGKRALIVIGVTTLLALPFFLRPFWIGLTSPEHATSPADAALLRDLKQFWAPTALIPKACRDLGRFLLVPFAAEGPAARWFPFHALLSITTISVAAGARFSSREPWRWKAARGGLLIALGYLAVGFHISSESFEKTGELYLVSIGHALLLGELLAGGDRWPRIRGGLGALLAVAMICHLQLLTTGMRVHADRVRDATASLARELDASSRTGGKDTLVIVGEERLDRGAVDAMVLALSHARGSLPATIDLVNGSQEQRSVARCPEGILEVGASGERFLRWDDRQHRFEELESRAARLAALSWRNPDPEPVHLRQVCLPILEEARLFTSETLLDLSVETILPRL